ncbi:hypothetical protein ACFWY5_28455 [Nonomuraea sp. NPDC059007]|uniref:hypothetical protein n=1 Tax=Nonomuraea sp. NPDC059007 TaxID=3346692 RepID=UPI0036ABE264
MASVRSLSWEWSALIIGAVIGLAFFIIPVSISVFGSDFSCGPSFVASLGLLSGLTDGGIDAALAQQCGVQGISRSLVGGLFAAGGAVTFLVLQGRVRSLPAPEGLVQELRTLHFPGQGFGGGSYECPSCHSSWPCPTGRLLGGNPM